MRRFFQQNTNKRNNPLLSIRDSSDRRLHLRDNKLYSYIDGHPHQWSWSFRLLHHRCDPNLDIVVYWQTVLAPKHEHPVSDAYQHRDSASASNGVLVLAAELAAQ
jgi:hypothetical protein